MTLVTEGLGGLVVEDTDMSVDVVEVEDDVKVLKVLEVVKALILLFEPDAVAGPIGKGVFTEAVDEAVDKDTVVDAAIDRAKVQYDA